MLETNGGHTPRGACTNVRSMTTNTNGRFKNALGEHLIVLLVVAMVVIGAVAAVPSLVAQSEATATQIQNRVNVPLTVAAELDEAP
jgi:hypothetical protein